MKGAVQEGAAGSAGEAMNGVPFDEIWSLGLTFGNRGIEDAYRMQEKGSISRMAGQLHSVGLLVGILTVLSLSMVHKLLLIEQLALLVHCILLQMIPMYLSKRHNSFFTEWYSLIVVTLEMVAAVWAAVCAALGEPRSSDPMFILVVWSPIGILLSTAVVYQTTFATVLPGQFCCMVLSHFWVYPFCKKAALAAKLLNRTHKLGWYVLSCMAGVLSVGGPQGDVHYPCVALPGFIHFGIGFVVPCTMKYILESHRRAEYLSKQFDSQSHELIWNHFWNGVAFSICTALFCLMSAWALCTTVAM